MAGEEEKGEEGGEGSKNEGWQPEFCGMEAG